MWVWWAVGAGGGGLRKALWRERGLVEGLERGWVLMDGLRAWVRMWMVFGNSLYELEHGCCDGGYMDSD